MKIFEYFPELDAKQRSDFQRLMELYIDWNQKINLISRKDIDQLETHHFLHALAIAKVVRFLPEARILDLGTGGGFPGIPLAVAFPEVEFVLVDSIAKKIRVVEDIVQQLGLKNVQPICARAETLTGKFDFVVSRAVTQMPVFLPWTKGKFSSTNKHPLQNGILYLKGGDLSEELRGIAHAAFPITDFFDLPFFDTKFVIYIPADVVGYVPQKT